MTNKRAFSEIIDTFSSTANYLLRLFRLFLRLGVISIFNCFFTFVRDFIRFFFIKFRRFYGVGCKTFLKILCDFKSSRLGFSRAEIPEEKATMAFLANESSVRGRATMSTLWTQRRHEDFYTAKAWETTD